MVFSISVNKSPEIVAPAPEPCAPASSTTTDTGELAAPKAGASLSNPPVNPDSSPFPEIESPPRLNPCSYNQCLSGHIWPAMLALAKCPGCTGGVIAVQKTNCPFCNEPVTRTVLRSDFIPRGGGVVARCTGQSGMGESVDVDLQRTEWQEIQGKSRTFLEQEAQNREAQNV